MPVARNYHWRVRDGLGRAGISGIQCRGPVFDIFLINFFKKKKQNKQKQTNTTVDTDCGRDVHDGVEVGGRGQNVKFKSHSAHQRLRHRWPGPGSITVFETGAGEGGHPLYCSINVRNNVTNL